MTLRARIAVTAACAVALAFLIAASGLYVTTARTLRGEVDRSLRGIAAELTAGRRPALRALGGVREGRLGGPGGFVQVVDAGGRVLGPAGGQPRLPVDDDVIAVAAGRAEPYVATVEVDTTDTTARVLTVRIVDGVAAQIARPLDEVDASLAVLRTRLVLGGLLGTALAVGLGVLVARGAVRPVERLTAVAEGVAATGDLSRRIDTAATPRSGDADELVRLARTFNAMLANLEQARAAQQQLVADASHELRTPLTSLRTNIEVLSLDADPARDDAAPPLDPADRRRLLADLTVQLDEFGRLVGALVELARGAQPARAVSRVRLDDLVEAAVDRARSFAGPGQTITVDAAEVTVLGEADRLDRAVANLLDNAVKYGGGEPIDVTVAHRGRVAEIVVRDRGPGIAAEHVPFVFDRFYRAPGARDVPGSGLGLAIVAQAAEAHGGTVDVASVDGGGARLTVQLPLLGADG